MNNEDHGPLGVRHPIFRPYLRRILVVGICLGWGAFEVALGNDLFALGALGVGVFFAYQYFYAWPRDDRNEGSGDQ